MKGAQNSKQQEEDKGIKQPSLVPTLELPKSGGALQGIGEKYTVNPATGTGNMSLPVGVTAGRGAPQLSLSYSSGAGNSPFGMGWNISAPQISRKTERRLPLYHDTEDSDTFILSGAEDLVKKLNFDGTNWKAEEVMDDGNGYKITRFRPRTEGLFARIERLTRISTGEVHWRSVSGENITSVYGDTVASRVADPADSKRIFSWLLCRTYDNKGNVTLFEYKQEDNVNVPGSASERLRKNNRQPQRYLKRILYGNQTMYNSGDTPAAGDFLFKVIFDYGEHDVSQSPDVETSTWPCRQDAFSSYRSGFEIRTRRLCRRVLMFHDFPDTPEFGLGDSPRLIQSTDLNFDENAIASQLTSVTSIAYEKDSSGYVENDMPPLEFTYSKATLDDSVKRITEANARNAPQGLSGSYQFTDLNAEGLSGVLTESADAWFYKRNLGEGLFDQVKTVSQKPNWSNLSGGTQLSNVESNGQLYLSRLGKNGGYSKREDDGSWAPFRNYTESANIDLADPDIRFVDLNGDGKPEILILRDQLLRWHPNAGEDGYGAEKRNRTGADETKAPANIFRNDLEGIFLSDMTGDGLSDILRIRNSEICYWPNLGYGNFGQQVVMDDAPVFDRPDLFETSKIRLADIDGSGTTDILYLGGNRTQYWFNRAGNSFAAPVEITAFPKTNNQVAVSLVDLLGNGTACLVWSSPLPADTGRPWRYVDIMSSTKPYLLTEVRNNMGAVTRTHYKPSTHFYLKDERDGTPWVTKLPFPVHVVHKNEVEDLITGHRFVSEYAYHHGYYDRAEREFRGFGFVEQWDDEAFKTPSEDDPTGEFHKPRIHTKTWIHTGAWEKETTLEQQYRKEYWLQESDETFLEESELLDAASWTATEIREAKRALRGQVLRTELYTDDDSADRDKPYTVSEARFQVKQLQPITDKNQHAVYISLPLESLSANYERNANDPRLTHEMTLEIDGFGNVLKSASIAYPRLKGKASDTDHCPEQYDLKIIYTENEVFNQDDNTLDWYVKGVPLSAKVYEVDHLRQSQRFPPFFQRENLLNDMPTATKKLLSAQVNYFRSDDDTEANNLSPRRLAFGEVQPLLLPYGTYQLVFTDKILKDAYDDLTDNWRQKIVDEGYLLNPHDGVGGQHDDIAGWWVTGGFAQYNPANFYTTTQVIDNWGNVTTVSFDALGLFPIKVEDPLENVVTAKYDYRILQPLEITDPNGNRQQVAYDGFGRVIRAAMVGKNGEGDVLDKATARDEFAKTDTETSVVEYKHREFYDSVLAGEPPRPNYVHSYTRETHHNDLATGETSRWMQARVYSDGFGRELQSKARIADGKAYYIDAASVRQEQADGERWLGSGRTIYDNKGQAVKQYEPYFSTTPEYEKEDELVMWGVSPFVHYDALGRAVRTDMPDGTFTKVEFSPWMSKTYDANDTVLDSDWYAQRGKPDPTSPMPSDPDERAAWLSAQHANLPATQLFDVLGRPVRSVQTIRTTSKADTGKKILLIGDAGNDEQVAASNVVLDTVGNPLQTYDANNLLALEAVFDLVGRPLKSISNDAGTSYILHSIDNQPVYSWLPRGHRMRMVYDKFRRPTELWVKENGGETIKEATLYGEEYSTTPETANMRGQVWKSFDAGGVAEVVEYDFKGAPLKSERHLFADHTEEWDILKLNGYINGTSSPDLETFTSSIKYDALGRPTDSIAPDGSITRNEYDQSGALQRVEVQVSSTSGFTDKVSSISYNEKGQREKIVYGNGVATTYEYDPLSYRLVNLRTKANTHLSQKDLQNLSYTYDAVGNIVQVIDQAQEDVFFRNQQVRPQQKFEYDSLSRLIKATGREHISQQGGKDQMEVPKAESGNGNQSPYYNGYGTSVPAPADLKGLRNYTQLYAYDKVGNILRWKHKAAQNDNYTRDYFYDYQNGGDSNRLEETVRGSNTTTYKYDAAGNILKLGNHIEPITWNFENQPVAMGFADNKQANYTYDAAGERIRKVILNDNAPTAERLYFGNYEVYREYRGSTIAKERTSLHVADDSGKVCTVETVTQNTAANAPTHEQAGAQIHRYQLSNHLGSVGMEVNQQGDIISFEEYHPYGTTAFYWKNTNISQKQYCYTGKERDEESGLSYHSARFYMPWVGRWLSADPAGMVDGSCLYQYSRSNPVMLRDGDGMQSGEGDDRIEEKIGLSYQIKKGDTYWDIGRKMGINYKKLEEWNKQDARKLKPGSYISLIDPSTPMEEIDLLVSIGEMAQSVTDETLFAGINQKNGSINFFTQSEKDAARQEEKDRQVDAILASASVAVPLAYMSAGIIHKLKKGESLDLNDLVSLYSRTRTRIKKTKIVQPRNRNKFRVNTIKSKLSVRKGQSSSKGTKSPAIKLPKGSQKVYDMNGKSVYLGPRGGLMQVSNNKVSYLKPLASKNKSKFKIVASTSLRDIYKGPKGGLSYRSK